MERNIDFITEIISFLDKCDQDYIHNIFNHDNVSLAIYYRDLLDSFKIKSNLYEALKNKLNFVVNQIDYHYGDIQTTESLLNFFPLSITEYIIKQVKEKKITDPILIARFVYLELCKVVYYDISYCKQDSPELKKKICNASVDEKTTKIFSYVVCTQWIKLYKYILENFGINVIEKTIPGQDHVWGEIEIDDNNIIIIDATEYINSSIDLSNAKAKAPTSGFIILPKKYSGIRLYDVYTRWNREERSKFSEYYDINRDLDMNLGIISSRLYPIEKTIEQNELFNSSNKIYYNYREIEKLLEDFIEFIKKLRIPPNMDGYELYSYYSKFITRLPKAVFDNISLQTLYVDSFNYYQNRMRNKFFKTPAKYYDYLEQLIYDRYYQYLHEDQKNDILEEFKNGYKIDELSKKIARCEMKIAEYNRNINLYYAINKLQFYAPNTGETLGVHLYEPMMGNKRFDNIDDYHTFVKKLEL